MNKEFEFNNLIADNLIYYRKINNLTQLQLAEKINYSDKSISKWERGESLPDIFTLYTICELFGITLNDLIKKKKVRIKSSHIKSKALITLVSQGICWFVAIIAYVLLKIIIPTFTPSWLAFIYAIPVSMILLIIFTKLWWSRFLTFISISGLIWTIPLSVYLSIDYDNLWMLFLGIIPIQIMIIFWFLLKDRTTKNL